MKIVLAIVILFSADAVSQPVIEFNSVINQEKPAFFVGVNNLITVKGIPDKFKLKASHGTVYKYENNEFGIYVDAEGADTITLSINGKILKQMIVPVEIVSALPVAKPGSVKDSMANVRQLLSNPYLRVDCSGSNYNAKYMVISFQVDISQQGNGDIQTFQIVGNTFPTQMKTVIESLQPGDQLNFTSIRAAGGPNGCSRRLPSFKIYVK